MAVATLALVLADKKIDWDAISRERPVKISAPGNAADAIIAKHCKMGCKHCQEESKNGEEKMNMQHFGERIISRINKVDWNKMK